MHNVCMNPTEQTTGTTEYTYFWRYANASGIVTFTSLSAATDWADSMLSRTGTATIVREA